MGKFTKTPSYVFDPLYDTKDMAVVKERRLKWTSSYPDPQSQLQNALSKIANTAELEKKRLRNEF